MGNMGNMFDQTRPLHSPNKDQDVNMLFLKLPRLPIRLHRLRPRQFGRRQIHPLNRSKGPISTSYFGHFQRGTELEELEGSAQTIFFGQAQEGTAVRGSAHFLARVEETAGRLRRNLQPNATAIGSLVHTSHTWISLSQTSGHIFDTLPRVASNQLTHFYSTWCHKVSPLAGITTPQPPLSLSKLFVNKHAWNEWRAGQESRPHSLSYQTVQPFKGNSCLANPQFHGLRACSHRKCSFARAF